VSLTVTASLRADGDRLRIRYEARNDGERPLWLLDDMVVRGAERAFRRTPAAIIVTEDEDPATVRLVRGAVMPEADVASVLLPGARRLGAGESLGGEAEAPLPLRASHPQAASRRLRGERTRAVVEIGAIAGRDGGEPPLKAARTADGRDVLIPEPGFAFRHQQLARSAVLPLP
jgi:hypothetical protein